VNDVAAPVSDVAAFTALFNFRDVGGYRTEDGRAVRRRRLYRSDSLHRIDGPDLEAFGALGIRTVVDLRRPAEVTRLGRVPEYDGLVYRHIHPEHRDWAEIPYNEELGLARYLADRYLDLAETGAAGIGEAVGIIADEAAAPVVVHCVAGKDRTGVVCALTLATVGVDDATIAEDYALSTAASQRFTAWLRTQLPTETPLPAPYLSSPAEAMLLFLDGLRQRHGTVEGYLLEAGLTRAQLDALRTHLVDG
jgi:protein tyrosine/serine phosphatase